MQQKLQFVTTVLHHPRLIILDEPFSGLDPVNSNLIKDEIFNLAKNGATIIFSTHRMEQVEEICDQVALVNKGKKILDDTVADIRQNFKEHLYRVAADHLPADLTTAPFSLQKKDKEAFIIKIKEEKNSNDVLHYLLQNGCTIYAFNEILPSLNEIFIRLVEGTPTTRQFENI
jgi:ABC-2 type transport system ATP-binding protein